MKKFRAIIAFIAIVAILCGFTASACASQYPRLFFVKELDYENDFVIFSDVNNSQWIWEGIEDWMIDDMAAAIMDDNKTPNNIYDDIIVTTHYQTNITN